MKSQTRKHIKAVLVGLSFIVILELFLQLIGVTFQAINWVTESLPYRLIANKSAQITTPTQDSGKPLKRPRRKAKPALTQPRADEQPQMLVMPYMTDDKELFVRLKSGTTRWKNTVIRVNSYGMRGDDPLEPKPPGLVRVLCIGDSVTFGWEVSEEASYPNQLRELLSQLLPDRRFEVLNAGVPSHSTYQGTKLLPRYLTVFSPEFGVVEYGINDQQYWKVADKDRNSAVSNPAQSTAVSPPIYTRLKVYKLVASLLGKGKVSETGYRRVSPADFEKNLRSIFEESRAHKCVPLILIPIQNPGQEIEYAPYLRHSAKKAEVSLVALADRFDQTKAKTLFLDPWHPTAEGYRIIANGIAETIMEQLTTEPAIRQ